MTQSARQGDQHGKAGRSKTIAVPALVRRSRWAGRRQRPLRRLHVPGRTRNPSTGGRRRARRRRTWPSPRPTSARSPAWRSTAIHGAGSDKAWQTGAGVTEMSLAAVQQGDQPGRRARLQRRRGRQPAQQGRRRLALVPRHGGLRQRARLERRWAATTPSRCSPWDGPGVNKVGDEARVYEAFLAPNADSGVAEADARTLAGDAAQGAERRLAGDLDRPPEAPAAIDCATGPGALNDRPCPSPPPS